MDWRLYFLTISTVIIVAALVIIRFVPFNKERAPAHQKNTTPNTLNELGSNVDLLRSSHSAPTFEAPSFNPLRNITFEDALNPERLAIHIQNETERSLGRSASASGLPVTNLAIQMLAHSKDGFVVTFDQGLAEFVRTADGNYKAITRGNGGVFREVGTIDLVGTWAGRIANTTAIIVATANLISNADASRRLGMIRKDQDRLFAYRNIDQRAALKTAYEELREEFSKTQFSFDRIDDIRHRIRNIRHTVLGEAERNLLELNSLFPKRKGLLSEQRKLAGDWMTRRFTQDISARASELSSFRDRLLLARDCLTFEGLAAGQTGASDHQSTLLAETRDILLNLWPEFDRLESEIVGQPSTSALLRRLFD